MRYFLLFVCFVLSSSIAQAGLLFNYAQLRIKDLDEMAKIVSSKVAESERAKGSSFVPLKEAIQAVYARPNEDFMIEKVVGPVKNALEDMGEYERVMRDLTTEAIGAIKNPKAFRPIIQVTYVVFLENIIAEFKPRLNQELERSVLQQIRDAKIDVSKAARDERYTRVIKETISPSELAEEVLAEYEKQKAEAEKASAAESKSED